MFSIQNLMGSAAACQICEREFSEQADQIPRILTECGHTLCTECASRILSVGGEYRSIACPYDRIQTSVPDGDILKLKKNFTVLQIREEEENRKKLIQSGQREMKQRLYDGSCDENSAHRAENYCKTCDADLCNECWDIIHAPEILGHHGKTSIFDKPIEIPECLIHSGKAAEFVCTVESCKSMENRLMCHVCFNDATSIHFKHECVKLQTEIVEVRTKIVAALKMARDKEAAIEGNMLKLQCVVETFNENTALRDKMTELKRFRYFDEGKEQTVLTKMKSVIDKRILRCYEKIANQKMDFDLMKKLKASLEKYSIMPNMKLVSSRLEVYLTLELIEKTVVNHPKSLATCAMCTVHLPSSNPLIIEIKPPYRLEIRETYNDISNFVMQNSTIVSPRTKVRRYKTHFFRIIDQTEDIEFYSEGLSLILVVDPFDGDHDRQRVALEFLENAPAYENIVVGLIPFNFACVSTFIAKLLDIGNIDPRIQIVYINDPEKDIEKMVALSMDR